MIFKDNKGDIMNLSVSLQNSMPAFFGRKKIYNDEYMQEKIVPYIESNIPSEKIVEEQNISMHSLNKWANEHYNMPFRKLYYTEINKTLASRLKEQQASGLSLAEIAQNEGHSMKWVTNRFKDFNILKQYEEQDKIFKELIPPMIEKGYTLEMMAREIRKISKAVKVSYSIISNWIDKTLGKKLLKIRTENKIEVNNDRFNYKKFKNILADLFKKGYSITEVSEMTGISKQKVIFLIDRYGITTKLRQAKKKLSNILEQRMADGYTSSEIAEEAGMTVMTVLKKAKRRYKMPFPEAQKMLMKKLK